MSAPATFSEDVEGPSNQRSHTQRASIRRPMLDHFTGENDPTIGSRFVDSAASDLAQLYKWYKHEGLIFPEPFIFENQASLPVYSKGASLIPAPPEFRMGKEVRARIFLPSVALPGTLHELWNSP